MGRVRKHLPSKVHTAYLKAGNFTNLKSPLLGDARSSSTFNTK